MPSRPARNANATGAENPRPRRAFAITCAAFRGKGQMSLLDQVRRLERWVRDRLRELEPLVGESEQLRKLAERLGVTEPAREPAAGGETPSAATTRRANATARAPKRAARGATKRPARRASKPQSAGSTARAGATARQAKPQAARATRARAERARPGQRRDDVLRLVAERPGITVREIAEQLGIDATGLYRAVNQLVDEGHVRKDGARLQPAEASPTRGSTPASAPEAGTADTTDTPAGADADG